MVGPLNGGSMDRVHVEVGVPVLSHFFHDLVPYLDCCLLSAHCDKYYEKRPSDNGARYRPPRPGKKATFVIIMVITMMIMMAQIATRHFPVFQFTEMLYIIAKYLSFL